MCARGAASAETCRKWRGPSEPDLGNASEGKRERQSRLSAAPLRTGERRVVFSGANARVNAPRIVIAGGGVCGLGVGWKLAQAGADVRLFDRAQAARGATWASAGMLAPQMELRPEEEGIMRLGHESLRRWRAFARELERDAGRTVDYRDEGALFVALDRDGIRQLQFLHDHQQEFGLPVQWLSGDEAREREPYLSRRVVAALYSSEDHQVDPRALADALVAAFTRTGGRLHEHAAVERVLVAGGRVTGVRVQGETIPADAVLIAAGAWSGMVEGLLPDVSLPVRPVKGQMIAVQQPREAVVQHCVWARDNTRMVYLAPKSDGRLLIGATVEEVGYDTHVTVGGMLDLLGIAWETLPALYDLPIIETWAGLRPSSRDNAPILGKTAIEGLYVATGHYRNGILFAPVTAGDISHLILTGETTESIAPFALERFGG
jgi:glycine oxidase